MRSVRRKPVIILTALVVAAPAMAAGTPVGRARVETVALRDGPGPSIELGLSRAVAPVVHRLETPPRVYVDLATTTLAPAVARTLTGTGAVKQVRLGQFDADTVRVVVDLASAVAVDVEPRGNTITLVVGPAGGAAVPATSKAGPAKAPVPPAERVAVAPPSAPAFETTADAEPRLAVARADQPLPPRDHAVASVRSRAGAVPHAGASELGERVARRAAADDWPGVVALYAANTRAIRRDADAATRAAVVDALRELGLTYSARKLLGHSTSLEAPALRIARAELVLAAGEPEDAAALVTGLEEAAVDPMLAPKLRSVRVRLALARGDLEGAATGIGTRVMPELRAELAHAAIRAGRTATQKRSCRRAMVAFRQALDADGGRTARAAAGAGLVRAALVCGDGEATMTGLGVLAESPHPLLRRAAAVIATTQTDDGRRAAATVGGGG